MARSVHGMSKTHSSTGRGQGAGWYAIRVEGRLEQRWSAWFDGATLTDGQDGTTVLLCHVDDQAALFGLIDKVGDLGLQLVSVTADTGGPARGACSSAG